MKKALLLFLLFTSFASFAQSSTELFDLGMTYHQNNPEKAIKFYTKTISKDPYHVDAYFNRGLLYYQDEDFEKAQSDFKNTVKISPKDAEAYENLANSSFVLNQFAQAKKYYDQAIILNPYSSDLFLNRAVCKSLLKDTSANKDFLKAIEINPRNVDALRSYGDFLFKNNESKKALLNYDKALSLNPKDAMTHNNKGKVNWSLKLKDEAIRDFTKAINLENNDQFLINRGLLYMEVSKLEASISDLHAATQLNPSNMVAFNALGFIYLKQKNYDKALQYFDFAIDNPRNPIEALKGHLEVCIAKKLYRKAKKDCITILKESPNDIDVKKQLQFCNSKIQ